MTTIVCNGGDTTINSIYQVVPWMHQLMAVEDAKACYD